MVYNRVDFLKQHYRDWYVISTVFRLNFMVRKTFFFLPAGCKSVCNEFILDKIITRTTRFQITNSRSIFDIQTTFQFYPTASMSRKLGVWEFSGIKLPVSVNKNIRPNEFILTDWYNTKVHTIFYILEAKVWLKIDFLSNQK